MILLFHLIVRVIFFPFHSIRLKMQFNFKHSLKMIIIMIEVKMQSVLKLKGVMPLNAPHFVVHIIAVQVSGQAIFIGAES